MLPLVLRPAPDALLRRRRIGTDAGFGTRWSPLLMLVWTFWIFATPLMEAPGVFPHWLWPTLASFALFLALYFVSYCGPRKYLFWSASGIGLLALLVTPFNAGAQGYVIYACSFFAFCGTPRQSFQLMTIALAAYCAEWLWILGFPPVYLINAVLVGYAVGSINLMIRLKQQRDAELVLSHEEVRRLAATAERERIGRDLHDLLGHTLSLVALKSELANRLWERDPHAARREVQDVERVTREALAQVRRAVTGIRAAGLAAELASARLLLESAGVEFVYSLPALSLPLELETALALAVREAATNIQRHAKAAVATLELSTVDGALHLELRDDGRGGDLVPGNGLSGMRERLEDVGACLSIDSVRGRGTCVRIVAPLDADVPPVAATPALPRWAH
jgi:two-component system sensor histidine kinase DesK